MKHAQRQLLRLAQAICESNPVCQEPVPIRLPSGLWDLVLKRTRRVEAPRGRGWSAAATRAAEDLCDVLEDMERALAATRELLAPEPRDSQFPALREIYADLVALEDEFADLDWDLKTKTLAAVTTPISFDDIQLGRFEIELHWEALSPPRLGCYRVIAQEPHPASSEEDVTHPHVQGDVLCEGQAAAAIHRALCQGRLLDFFMLVRSVLETYNAHSPYVPIEQWEGIRCDECDASLLPSHLNCCPNCDRRLCEDCYASCPACDGVCCYECRADCASCDETFCAHCLATCPECGRPVCPNCRDPQLKCEKCHDSVQFHSVRSG